MTGSYRDVPIADGGAMSAYYVPAASGPAKALLIVFQEIFGVNANMRQTAEAFAARGFDVVVPDLFWRQEPGVELDPATDHARAMALMQGLDQEKAIDDAFAAAAFVQQSEGASAKLVAVGYCLGGRLAYLAAMRPNLRAAVSYYGVAIEHALGRASELQVPLLLHIGLEDALCPLAARTAIRDALDPLPGVQILEYANAGHAFARYGSPARHPASADKADTETVRFLDEQVG